MVDFKPINDFKNEMFTFDTLLRRTLNLWYPYALMYGLKQ